MEFPVISEAYSNAGAELEPRERQPAPLLPHQRPPEGVALRGNRLVVPGSEEPIELGAGHGAARWHSFALSPSGEHIFVASVRELEEEMVDFELYTTPHRTRVDYVHSPTREVRRVLDYRDDAEVFEHGGDAYLTASETGPRRFVGFDPDDDGAVPRGLFPKPPG